MRHTYCLITTDYLYVCVYAIYTSHNPEFQPLSKLFFPLLYYICVLNQTNNPEYTTHTPNSKYAYNIINTVYDINITART